MNLKKSVTHYKKRYFLQISFIYLLILLLSSNALAMDWHVYWTPEEITEELTTGETIEKYVSFTLEGKSNIDTKIMVTPDLRPFVSVDPKKIKITSLDQDYSFKILLSIPENTTPGVYEGGLKLKRWIKKKKGWKRIPPKLVIKLAVNAANAAPVISSQSPNPLITSEETALSIALADLIVTDPDNTFPDDFTLTVQDGDNYDRVDDTITPALDFNGTLAVQVKVNDGQADSNVFNLSVSVTAINDAPTAQDAIFTVAENALNNTGVGSVLAFDPDDSLNFAITGGNDDGVFEINSSSGKITVSDNTKLDYETTISYTLDVQVTDPGNLTDTAVITINVIDVYEGLSLTVPSNLYPTRIAKGGPGGKYYVSDAEVGSIFIYDSNLNLTGKLNGLDNPLGIAVDQQNGNIFVGNDGRDNVETYSAEGEKLFTFGDDDNGEPIEMPNDMAFDGDGNLYVADSKNRKVKVYNSSGQWLSNIGEPGLGNNKLNFPVAVAINGGELYVADQNNIWKIPDPDSPGNEIDKSVNIHVFDFQGNFLRSFGERIRSFSSDWQGKFAKIQSLAFDGQNRLHALDCYLNKIQILDPETGQYIGSYGTFGTDMGQLNLPLDIFITNSGQVAVTNAGNHRAEIIYTIP